MKMKMKMKAPIKTTLFSSSFIQKHFLQKSSSSSSAADAATVTLSPLPIAANSSSFTVQFLVNSCGVPLKSALSASLKLNLHQNNIHKTQAVIQFLKSHHFSNTHIANLIRKNPQLLLCKLEGNLKPKFEFLVANGFAGNLLPQLVLSNPFFMRRSLDSQIKPFFQFLKLYLDSNEKIALSLKRYSRLLSINLKAVMLPNVDFLIKEGVPLDRVAKFIISQPRSLCHKRDWVVYAVNFVKDLGIQPEDNMFIYALAVRIQLSDTIWKKKIEVMKSLGWSEEEIFGAFKRYPHILQVSEKKIRSNMDFLINTFELEREILLVYPYLVYFSLDKRIRPRYNVINLLKSKDLIKGDNKKIPNLLIISEKKFMEKYVVKYAGDVPGLLKVYIYGHC